MGGNGGQESERDSLVQSMLTHTSTQDEDVETETPWSVKAAPDTPATHDSIW